MMGGGGGGGGGGGVVVCSLSSGGHRSHCMDTVQSPMGWPAGRRSVGFKHWAGNTDPPLSTCSNSAPLIKYYWDLTITITITITNNHHLDQV